MNSKGRGFTMFLNIGIDKAIMEAALNGNAEAQGIYRQAIKVAEAKAALSAAKRLVDLEQAEEGRLLNAYNRANGGVILPPEYIDGDAPTMCGDPNCAHPGH